MKINTKKPNSPLKKILIAVACILLVGAAAYAVWSLTAKDETNSGKTPANGIDYNAPTDEQKAAGDRQKDETIKESDGSRGQGSGDAQTLGVSFTALNQTDDQVQIRTLIDTVSSSGDCTVTLTKNGTTVTKQSGIQAGPNSSTCMGFNVPTSELSSGTWSVTVSVSSGTQKGSVTKDITVR